MKFLQVSPEIHMPQQVEASWEIQRSGLEIYPLTGEVTERQIADQCQAKNGYDGILFLTHGGPRGIMLKPSQGTTPGGADEVWMPLEAVVAYVKASDATLVVLASCDGRGLSREIYFRSGALVVYSEGDLATTTAYTLMSTFLRQLRDRTLGDALEVADALGLSYYPNRVGTIQKSAAEFLQAAVAVLSERIDRIDTLFSKAASETGKRRLYWLFGIGLILLPIMLVQLVALYRAGYLKMEHVAAIVPMVLVGVILTMMAMGLFGRD